MKTLFETLHTTLVLLILIVPLNYSQDFQQFIRFPFQDSTKVNRCQSQPLIIGNEIGIFFSANNSLQDTIFFTLTSDNGQNWSPPVYVANLSRDSEELLLLSGIISNSGRILLVYTIGEVSVINKTKIVHSDDNGVSWSTPQNVIGSAYIPYPKMTTTLDGKLWIVGRNNLFFCSTNDGNTWSSKNLGFSTNMTTSFDLISLDTANYFMTYDKYDSFNDKYKIVSRKSSNSGESWSNEIVITELDRSEKRPHLFQETNGTIWLITQNQEPTPFTTTYGIYQQNISYRKSTDNGEQWEAVNNFTNYLGYDGSFNICQYNDKPLITYLSDRWYGNNQIWIGHIGVTLDNDSPPVLYKSKNLGITVGMPISIQAFVGSNFGIQKAELFYEKEDIVYGPLLMFDDGNHNDGVSGDNLWGLDIGPFNYYDVIKTSILVTDNNLLSVTFPGNKLVLPNPEIENKWLSIGSLHNWYSSMGAEIEEGFIQQQQYGLQWNAIAPKQDIQASKGLWIGATNFTDQNTLFFPHKVVHVGPRVTGEGEFFPVEFRLISKYETPVVNVNGTISQDKLVTVDEIDPNLFTDRVIINKVNTQLGITMTRKIFQFSQNYNDNYIISEYTFKNTGNVNGDPIIELPNTTLTDVYFYYLYRLAICANTRWEIGNGTGWGMNTMIDVRGDGVMTDPPGENFRAQYIWHGKYPPFTMYDNIGGPIWYPAINVDPEDTVGRLGASQFAGVVTLHADLSANNNSDDISQPKTTSWEGSDEPLTSQNNPFNIPKMTSEYTEWMSRGHRSPRHAYQVEPSGHPGFLQPTGDPALGTPGGFSICNGYGPYILGAGDSVTIVFAEAVAGISRELAIETGINYKQGQINALQKNTVVFQSRDSLFQTFRNAIENYLSGYQIPQPPKPPLTFNVNSDSFQISLEWTIDESNPPANFRIYRTFGRRYNQYQLIAELPQNARSFVDTFQLLANTGYYYYLTCVGSYQPGGPATPQGRLESGRFYTQTYDPVQVDIGTSLNDRINSVLTFSLSQNYPNPFNPNTKIEYSIPKSGHIKLKVYDILGNEVATLVNEVKSPGNYAAEFDASTFASGVYIYTIRADNFVQSKKMILMK
jgi:hypothetical protein